MVNSGGDNSNGVRQQGWIQMVPPWLRPRSDFPNFIIKTNY